jgi:hypothetical protein
MKTVHVKERNITCISVSLLSFINNYWDYRQVPYEYKFPECLQKLHWYQHYKYSSLALWTVGFRRIIGVQQSFESRVGKKIHTKLVESRGSSVGKVTVYGLDERGSGVRFSAGAGNFFLLHPVQTSSGVHLVYYPMDTGGLFPRCKAAGTWIRPLTSL